MIDRRWWFVYEERRLAVADDFVMLPRRIPHAYGCEGIGRRLGDEQMFLDAGAPGRRPCDRPRSPHGSELRAAAAEIELIAPSPALED